MNNNLKLDPNKMMVRIAQQQIRIVRKSSLSENNEKSNDGKSHLQSLMEVTDLTDNVKQQNMSINKDDETVLLELNKAFWANELKLIHKRVDPDLDSIGNDSIDEVPQLNNIILNDIASTTSSITTTTNDKYQPIIPDQFITHPEDTTSLISTVSSLDSITSSIHSITRDKMESLFEVGMTQQEPRERAGQYTFQQLRKVMIEKKNIWFLIPRREWRERRI
jgi:phage terminase Nu1 subunit (DNA packaging protein)